MTDEVDVVRRLLDRAEWHEEEARRIRSAAEIVAAELGVSRAATRPRTRRSRRPGANTIPGMIVAIVDADPREWPLADLRDELVERGLNANDDNVRTAARRLAERGQIAKVRTGVYSTNTAAAIEVPSPINANGPTEAEPFEQNPRPLAAVAAVGGAVSPPH